MEGDEYMLYGMRSSRSARGDETVVRDSEMTTLAGLNGSGVLTPILGDVEELRVDHGVSVVPPDYYHFRSGWDAAFLPTLHPSIPSSLDYRGFCDAPSLEWSTHLLPSLISGRQSCQNGGGGRSGRCAQFPSENAKGTSCTSLNRNLSNLF